MLDSPLGLSLQSAVDLVSLAIEPATLVTPNGPKWLPNDSQIVPNDSKIVSYEYKMVQNESHVTCKRSKMTPKSVVDTLTIKLRREPDDRVRKRSEPVIKF
jgi:hypothetical protein